MLLIRTGINELWALINSRVMRAGEANAGESSDFAARCQTPLKSLDVF